MKIPPYGNRVVSMVLVAVSLSALCQQSKGKGPFNAAKSQGTDQSAFVMTIKPADTPFCNLGEIGVNSARALESVHVPALVTTGVCEQSQPIWELSNTLSAPRPFIVDGVWSDQIDVWKNVLQGVDLGVQSGPVTGLKAPATQNQRDIEVKPWPKVSLRVAQQLTLLVDSPSHPELVVADVKAISSDVVSMTIAGTGVWSRDHVDGAPVQIVAGKTGPTCIAGAFETLLERSYHYGFCSDKLNNVSTLQLPSAAFDASASDYYVVNIVVWDKTDKEGYSVKSSRWYTVNFGDHGSWTRQSLPAFPNALRIYGTKKPIGLIGIHIRDPKTISWSDFQKLAVKYTVTVKSKTAANVSDFQTAVSIIESGSKALSLPDPDGFYGAGFFKAVAPADITISSEVTFPPAVKPSPGQASTGAVGQFILRGTALRQLTYRSLPRVKLQDAALVTSPALDRDPSSAEASRFIFQQGNTTNAPSGSTNPNSATGKRGGTSDSTDGQSATTNAASPSVTCQAGAAGKDQSPCTLTATVNDENLYHWDVAFAVPFKTLPAISYLNPSSPTNANTVVPKTVTRENAYAFFEVYPIAVDIITPPMFSLPHFFAGLPISGQVFNKPMFGMGEGINLRTIPWLKVVPLQVQFFGGVAYNKEFRQIPGTTGSSNVVGHRVWLGTYGIEIPVSQFKSLVTSKAKKSATPSGTAAKSTQ